MIKVTEYVSGDCWFKEDLVIDDNVKEAIIQRAKNMFEPNPITLDMLTDENCEKAYLGQACEEEFSIGVDKWGYHWDLYDYIKDSVQDLWSDYCSENYDMEIEVNDVYHTGVNKEDI